MKKRKIKSILWTAGVLLVVAVLVIIPFLMEQRTAQNDNSADITSATAQMGSITSSYSGGGSLRAQEAVSVSIPENVMLTEFLVRDGEMVTSGQSLAKTDRVSVMEAVANVQETLDTLNEQLQDVADEEAESTLTALAGGRVMAIYGQEGDAVQEVMLEHGALAVISLDGKLAVDFECDQTVTTGSGVLVRLPDGEEITGRVESSLAGKVCVSIPDDEAALDDPVTVKTAEGTALGTGTLYAHNAWRATAYTGVIESVDAEVGERVDDGTKLMTLSDTEENSEYQVLCAKHRVYEEILSELFVLYQDGEVKAKSDGMVTLPADTEPYLLSASAQTYTLHFLSNEPAGGEGAQYTNMVGLVKACADGAFSMNMCPSPVAVDDYLQLSMPQDSMTEAGTYTPDPATPVFTAVNGEWQQGGVSDVRAGDILLFAYSQDTQQLVWIVRVASNAPLPDDPDHPDNPDNPDYPDNPDNPNNPDYPNIQDNPINPNNPYPSGNDYLNGGGFQIPGNMSGYGSFGSAFSQSGLYAAYGGTPMEEQVAALYTDSEKEILSVTPCDEMYLDMTVDELDILDAKLDQKANVIIDALPGRTFDATVTEISNQGINIGGNSKFTVTLTLPREDTMLPGMNASAEVPLESFENILTIPVSALYDQGSKTYVYCSWDKENGLGTMTEVQTGISDGDQVEILSGINENDTVWYEYKDKVEISNEVPLDRQRYFRYGG